MLYLSPNRSLGQCHFRRAAARGLALPGMAGRELRDQQNTGSRVQIDGDRSANFAAGRVSVTVKDYLSLAKPRVVLLHLIVAAAAVFLAAGGPPPPLRLVLVLIAGSLAAAGA